MIDGDHHHVPFVGEVAAVIAGMFLPIARCVTAAMQPEEYRALATVVESLGPDVEPQAVFGGITIVPLVEESGLVITPSMILGLRTDGPPVAGGAHALPGLGCRGWLEAFSLGVGYSLIGIDTPLDITGHLPILGIGFGFPGRTVKQLGTGQHRQCKEQKKNDLFHNDDVKY